jgi:hypothetical protein
MFALFYVTGSVTDRVAVLNNILAFLDVAERVLVSVLKVDVNVIKLIY